MPTSPGRRPDRQPVARPKAANRPSGQRPQGRPARRSRSTLQPTFVQRNRTRLIWAGALAAVLALGGLAYFSLTAPAYACSIQWVAQATPSPQPSATPRMGYPQDDMGRSHVPVGTKVKYLYCPPASGDHYAAAPQGPIQPRVYGPNEKTVPEGWVHNLEHGGLVLLYNCGSGTGGDGCSDTAQATMKQLYNTWPLSPICQLQPGVLGPVIARFDDMAYPYAALLWDEVLPLQTLDTQQILAFFQQRAERINPEQQCPPPSAGPSAAPSATLAPTASPTQPPASALPSTSPAPAAS